MTLLSLEGVSHRFADGTFGIRDVSLTVDSGDFIVIAGRNGSGKTVLIHHLVGLLKPAAGRIVYRGLDIAHQISTVRRSIGIVFQNPDDQFLGHTVAEDVAIGPENLGLDREEIDRRVDESLERIGITGLADQRPFFLSGGEKRKVALAGILAMESEIVLFDEPFIGLDLPGVRMVLEAILEIHASGKTIIVISHDVDKVLAHAGRLVIMSDGKVVADGPPEKLIDRLEEFDVRRPPGELSTYTWLGGR